MRSVAWGAFACALAVVAGAFGAHGLEARLSPAALALWETAARYLVYGGFGLIATGLAAAVSPASSFRIAARLLGAGATIFSGTLFALALGGPRWLGAVTPFGGLLLVAGFATFAWAAWRSAQG